MIYSGAELIRSSGQSQSRLDRLNAAAAAGSTSERVAARRRAPALEDEAAQDETETNGALLRLVHFLQEQNTSDGRGRKHDQEHDQEHDQDHDHNHVKWSRGNGGGHNGGVGDVRDPDLLKPSQRHEEESKVSGHPYLRAELRLRYLFDRGDQFDRLA